MLCAVVVNFLETLASIFDFRLVELAWDNAGKRTGSGNHEKPHNSSASQVRSGPVSAFLVVSKGCKLRVGIALGSGKFQPLRALWPTGPHHHKRIERMLIRVPYDFRFRLSGFKGLQAVVSPPVQRSTVNLNHCARFVFLSRAID